MSIKRALIATLAALGMGGQHTAAVAHAASQTRQVSAVNNGQTTRQIKEDHFGGYSGSIFRGFMRDRGHTPYEWGTSRACAQMVRKNRMRRKGIAGSRI